MALRSSLLLALLTGCACNGGKGSQGAVPQGVRAKPDTPASGRAAAPVAVGRPPLSEPPPLSAKALAQARQAFRRGVRLGQIAGRPQVGAAGDPIVDRSMVASILPIGEPASKVANDRKIHVFNSLFARVPSAQLKPDGSLRVSYATTRPSPAASVYFGNFVPEEALRLPRYRLRSSSLTSEPGGREHALELDLRLLLHPSNDVAQVAARGRGELVWRLEALDPQDGTARVYDGVTAFRCEPAPCRPGARFVQLPSIWLGPFVDQVGPRTATVSWSTDVPTAGALLLVDSRGSTRSVGAASSGLQHEVELAELQPGTRYRYYVQSVDRRGEVSQSRGASFRTAPASSQAPIRFVVLSDSRSGMGSADERYAGSNRRVLEHLLLRALDTDPHFVVFVGDLIDGYTTEPGLFRHQLQAWKRVTSLIGAHVPIYEVMGNHEALLEVWQAGWAIDRPGAEGAEVQFAEQFVNPRNGPSPSRREAPPYLENVYSFDVGAAHMTVINSNYWWRSHPHRNDHPRASQGQREGWVDDTQLAWLDADLAKARARGARHLFVFTHEPGFPNGGHVYDAMYWGGRVPEVLQQRERLFRILGRHRVCAIFHGDEHNYSRLQVDAELVAGMKHPVWQIITGGAGAPYYVQDHSTPWARKVARFDSRQHLVRIGLDAQGVALEALSLTGDPIERLPLKTCQPST